MRHALLALASGAIGGIVVLALEHAAPVFAQPHPPTGTLNIVKADAFQIIDRNGRVRGDFGVANGRPVPYLSLIDADGNDRLQISLGPDQVDDPRDGPLPANEGPRVRGVPSIRMYGPDGSYGHDPILEIRLVPPSDQTSDFAQWLPQVVYRRPGETALVCEPASGSIVNACTESPHV